MDEQKTYKNIYYFRLILKIGGTEQFLYEIAKKYSNYDLTIFYDEADAKQLERLKKYVRCEKRVVGKKIKCERAFFNFNIDMIDDVEADDYYFVIHANYDVLGYIPPTHPKINHYIGVSEFATRRFKEDMGIEAERCYNPLTLEPKEEVIHIVSAGRLDDKVKDNGRTLKLIKALDDYCFKNNRHYIWTIFSNPISFSIDSPNVVLMKPRTDVRAFIQDADYVVQLSNDMETYCYTLNEALGYGVHIITTPLSICKELPIPKEARIECEYDMSNIDEVVKKIFEPRKEFEYKIPKDGWDKLLVKSKSTYKEELKKKYIVEATDIWQTRTIIDIERNCIPKEKEQWEVNKIRLDELINNNTFGKPLIRVVKEILNKEEKK